MARYFFNVRNHVHTQDDIGTELAGMPQALEESHRDIADIKRAEFSVLDSHWDGWSIEVCDEGGALVLTVPFITN